MSTPIVLTPQTAPESWKVVGEEITALAVGSQTGSYEIFRQDGPEGSGPPPHFHPWDEAFFVVDGCVTIGLDGMDDVQATAGCFVHVPAGTTHFFRFGEGGGTMVSVTSRAGASEFFAQVAAEVSPVDPDLPTLVEIAAARGLTILPPPQG
jgi:quercetin dioxygenase-like cupin family protein